MRGRRGRGEEGAALAEWSVVVPTLMLFILILLQLIAVSLHAVMAHYAAYAGARAAVVHAREASSYAGRAARLVLAASSPRLAALSTVSVAARDRVIAVEVSVPAPGLAGAGWWPWWRVTGRCALAPEWPVP